MIAEFCRSKLREKHACVLSIAPPVLNYPFELATNHRRGLGPRAPQSPPPIIDARGHQGGFSWLLLPFRIHSGNQREFWPYSFGYLSSCPIRYGNEAKLFRMRGVVLERGYYCS